MQIDINPIQDDGLTSCLDDLIQSIGLWSGKDFRLMYLDSWKFVFADLAKIRNNFWDRSEISSRLYFDDELKSWYYLDKFHGLKFKMQRVKIEETEKIICENIDLNRPIITIYDTYFLKWLDKFYHKEHSWHAILCVGYDKNCYFFNDSRPFFQLPIKAGIITQNEFQKGCAGIFITLETHDVQYEYADIYTELAKINFDMFEAMKKFGVFIQKYAIKREDVENFGGSYGCLIRAIRNIIRGRKHFIECLEFMIDKYALQEFHEFIIEMNSIIKQWEIIKNLLYKGYLKGNYSQYNVEISRLVLKCASMEEALADRLMTVLKLSARGER